jgi:hypothetical protein
MGTKTKRQKIATRCTVTVLAVAAIVTGFVSCHYLIGNTVENSDTIPGFTYDINTNDDGSLQYDLTLTMGALPNNKTIEESLKTTSDEWNDFVAASDPLPFLVVSGGQSKQYAVWTESNGTMVLNNSGATGNLVIPRYWEPAWGTLTVGTWPGTNAQRKAAFLEAKGKIEALMADMKASGFYEVSYTEDGKQVFPLKDLHASMGDFIKVPTTGTLYTDRGPWGADDWDNRGGTQLHPTKTGPLYELYFGHIPERDEYYLQSDDAEYVYPVD